MAYRFNFVCNDDAGFKSYSDQCSVENEIISATLFEELCTEMIALFELLSLVPVN